jgi:hypothetical protein
MRRTMRRSRKMRTTEKTTTSDRPQSDLVTLEVVAERLDCSVNKIKKLHNKHGLPLVRFPSGGQYYALWSAVEVWARGHLTGRNGAGGRKTV